MLQVEWLADELNRRDFTVSAIHSSLEPSEREEVMRNFRQGVSRVLISTDLLARGIDVQGVSLVINFDLPRDKENVSSHSIPFLSCAAFACWPWSDFRAFVL